MNGVRAPEVWFGLALHPHRSPMPWGLEPLLQAVLKPWFMSQKARLATPLLQCTLTAHLVKRRFKGQEGAPLWGRGGAQRRRGRKHFAVGPQARAAARHSPQNTKPKLSTPPHPQPPVSC